MEGPPPYQSHISGHQKSGRPSACCGWQPLGAQPRLYLVCLWHGMRENILVMDLGCHAGEQ